MRPIVGKLVTDKDKADRLFAQLEKDYMEIVKTAAINKHVAEREITAKAMAKLTAEKDLALSELKEKDQIIVQLTVENYRLQNLSDGKKRKHCDGDDSDKE